MCDFHARTLPRKRTGMEGLMTSQLAALFVSLLRQLMSHHKNRKVVVAIPVQLEPNQKTNLLKMFRYLNSLAELQTCLATTTW